MPTGQPTIRPTGRLTLLSLATVLAATAACVSNQPATGDPATTPSTPSASNTTPTSPPSPTSEEIDTVTAIRITVGGETVTGELNDSPTAQDLARQLPLTITLADFNNVEKVGELPRALTMNGVPGGADPEVNDIGYYRPSNGLVFYYRDVGYFNGIVRIGKLPAAGMQLVQRQTGNFTITIEEG
jgi:hypothetical protein